MIAKPPMFVRKTEEDWVAQNYTSSTQLMKGCSFKMRGDFASNVEKHSHLDLLLLLPALGIYVSGMNIQI